MEMETITWVSRLADKFIMSLRANLHKNPLPYSPSGETRDELIILANEAMEENDWQKLSYYAARLWHYEQSELLKRDFLTKGDDPEHLLM